MVVNKMAKLQQLHQINISATCNDIEDIIKKTMFQLKRDGAVLGLSGGLDSAVTAALTVRSLGAEKVHFLNLPEKDSKPIHKEHAKFIAKHLGVKLKTKSITPILRASKTYRLLPIHLIPFRKLRGKIVEYAKSRFFAIKNHEILEARLKPEANSWIAKGNAYAVTKHRMRMVMIYQYADRHNLMVVGAANKTEWLTGTFCKWGVDHCADVMPIIHIYRSQLEEIAKYLEIPEVIQNKPPDPDVLPGIPNKEELVGETAVVDQILFNLENNNDLSEFYNLYGKDAVDRIVSLFELSKHMRESPYKL
ncbi:MAG: NAD(+) synthase [Candidatus Heimdallarchaeota archaeon]|nr:NAD(+) synthase [Candidatus Heimdallarchaeota archaeon]